MADGKIVIDTSLDSSGITKDLSKLQSIVKTGASSLVTAISGVTAALSTAGVYALKVGSDFEAGMSEVEAISGATVEEMQDLTDKAKEMGAKTKFSATESADAFKYMAMAGWETGDMLKGIEGIMNLAAASGENLASVSDIVTDALTAFGLEAKDSAHFADILAKASSSSNTNVGLMGATFKYVAPIAGAMKYSIEDMAVAIGLMANAGIKGEQAGTALRSMLTRLSKPPKDAAAALDKLSISVTNTDGTMKPLSEVVDDLREKFADLTEKEKMQYASSIAGQEAMSGLLAIVNAADDDYEKLTAAINDANGAALEQSKIMQDNLKGDVTLLKSAVEGLGIQFHESMDKELRGAVQNGTGYVEELSNAFSKGGLQGVVEECGDIFADIAVDATAQAPKMVDASVEFIESFVGGLKKNKGKLTKAAGDLTKTLTNALIKLLPKEMQKPVKKAVDSIVKTLTGNGLKNSLKTANNLFENTGKIVGNLAKVTLPPLAKAFDLCANNTDLMVAALAAGLVVFKGYTIINTMTKSVSSLSAITTMLTAAEQANALQVLAASRALTTKEMIVGVLTGKITLATAAQTAWNAVMAANPVGLLVTGIAALAAGIVAYSAATHEAQGETSVFTEEQRKLHERIEEQKEAWQQLIETRNETIDSIQVESTYTKNLASELMGIVDENGKIKNGYEERASVITGLLADALGIEIEITDGVIQNYGELKQSINEVILAKKAEALINAYQETYAESLKGVSEAQENYNNALETANKKMEAIKVQEAIVNDLRQKATTAKTVEDIEKYGLALNDACVELALLQEAQSAANADLNDAESAYTEMISTITGYEGLVGAQVSGDAQAINAACAQMIEGFVTAESGTKESLERQLENYRSHYEQVKSQVAQGMEGVSQETADQYALMCSLSLTELEKFRMTSNQEFQYLGNETISVLGDTSQKTVSLFSKMLTDMLWEVQSGSGELSSESSNMASDILAAYDSMPPDAQAVMNDVVKGMLLGLDGGQEVIDKADEMGTSYIDQLREVLGVHSPSKKTQSIFSDVVQGMVLGLTDNQDSINEAGTALMESFLDTLKNSGADEQSKKIGADMASGIAKGITSKSSLVNKAANMLGTALISGLKGSKADTIISQYGTTVGNNLITAINGKVSGVQRSAAQLGNAVNTGMKSANITNFIARHINEFTSCLVSGIKGKCNVVALSGKELAQSVVKGIQAGDLPNAAQNVAKEAVSAFNKGIQTGSTGAAQAGRSLASSAANALSEYGLYDNGYSAGLNFTYGLSAGIRAGASGVIASASLAAEQALKAVKNKLDIHSPSRVMENIGQLFSKGFAVGISDKTKEVVKSAFDMTHETVDAVKNMRSSEFDLNMRFNLEPIQIEKIIAQMKAAVAQEKADVVSSVVSMVNAQVYAENGNSDTFDYDKMADMFANKMSEQMRGINLKYNNREVARMVKEVSAI